MTDEELKIAPSAETPVTTSTFKQVIKARYEQETTEIDAFGRAITVKRLRPSQQMIVSGMAGDDSLSRAVLLQAASIVSIEEGGKKTTYPQIGRDRGSMTFYELEALLDCLEQEGLGAVGKAMKRLGEL